MWLYLAQAITHSQSEETFHAHFGLSLRLVAQVWDQFLTPIIQQEGQVFLPIHLLWTLFFLKSTPFSLDVAVAHLKCSTPTLYKHIKVGVTLLNQCLPQVLFCFFNFQF